VLAGLSAIGIAAACPASAGGPVGGVGNAQNVTIWVPDYYGHNVFVYKFDYTTNPLNFTSRVLKIQGSGSGGRCNPNAVAVLNTDLYIVCSSGSGGPDAVVVYNTSTLGYKKQITGIATDGHNYFTGGQLIAILFDSHAA